MSQIELPQGWFNATIQDVAEIKGGKRLPKGKNFSTQKTDHAYIRVTDMSNGSIDQSDIRYIDEETYKEISNYFISKDDLNISIAGTIGLVGDIPQELDGANLTENAAKICTLTGVEKQYLKYVLNSQIAKEQFEDKVTSSGQPKLALFRIRDCKFPLPPLAEQKIIADKLDTLLAQVESIKARLERIPEILKQFRQSVLVDAVSGKLTAEWRENRDGAEWEKINLEEITLPNRPISYGVLKPGEYVENGVVLLRIKDLLEDKIDPNEPHRVSLELSQQFKRTILSGGEIVISLVGTIGRIGLIPQELSGSNVHRNLGVIAPSERVLSEFLFYQMKSDQVQKQIAEMQTGANQPLLNLGDIKKIEILIPSIDEQREIVRCINNLFSNADVIDTYVQLALNRVNNLTQSILAKAFRGELTAEWREANTELIIGENSAEALLERIKAERELAKPATKRGRGKA